MYDSAGNKGQEALGNGNWKSARGSANGVYDGQQAERVQWVGEGEVVGELETYERSWRAANTGRNAEAAP